MLLRLTGGFYSVLVREWGRGVWCDFMQVCFIIQADALDVTLLTLCRFYGAGFVALLSNNQLISVPKYEEPRPKVLATPPEGDVHSWTLIPPAYTLSRSVEVLLSIGQTIHVVDTSESEDRLLDIGPFTYLSVSPNGKFVALYTEGGKAFVITSDFQNRLSEHNSRSKTPPKDLQWCGNDAVVIAWEDEVHIIGPNDAAAKYFYDGRVHLVAGKSVVLYFQIGLWNQADVLRS